MINSVSNVSFKAIKFYEPRYPELTKSQEEIKEDIVAKFKQRKEETNGKFDNRCFYIKPLDKDTIELSELFRVKEIDAGKRKNIKFSNPLVIGEYDKKNPFKIEDYDRVTKEDAKQNLLGCMAQLLCFLAIIAIPLCMRTSKTSSTAQTEKATTVVKDSVQKVAKDTLQLFK
jgi:hypothetical protein